MAKEGILEYDGVVTEILPGGMYRIKIDEIVIIAYSNGNIRRNNISIAVGDKVKIEVSPYDLTRGRISYRYK